MDQNYSSCPVCGQPVVPDASACYCPSCMTLYHLQCWNVAGGCVVSGCPSCTGGAAPATQEDPGATTVLYPGLNPFADQPAPPVEPPKPPKKKGKAGAAVAIVAAVLVIAVAVWFVLSYLGQLKTVKLSRYDATLKVGKTLVLEYSLEPEDYEPESVTWTSSDPSIATVEDGKVTAVFPGTCTVTVNVDGKEAACEVTVIGVKSLTLSHTSLSIHVGETVTLTYTAEPADYKADIVNWDVRDDSVAYIGGGTLTARAVGKTLVTLRVDNMQVECTLEVTMLPEEEKLVGAWKLTGVLDMGSGTYFPTADWAWTLDLNSDYTALMVIEDSETTKTEFVWSYTELLDGYLIYELTGSGSQAPIKMAYVEDKQTLLVYITDTVLYFMQ